MFLVTMVSRKKAKNSSYWIKNVKTTTVDVPPGTMTKSPEEIARILLRKNKFKGASGSINRFIQFHINRTGKSMSKEKIKKLKRAQELVREKSRKK